MTALDLTPALSPEHEARLEALSAILEEMGQVLVTFSGGVDSALVLAVAKAVLGDRAIALTAVSPTFPPEERDLALSLARQLQVQHLVVDSDELSQEGYARNAGDRCYFCKSELFALARTHADRLGIPWVVDGTITDDFGDHRPGLKAGEERAVRHPLAEAGMDKAAVRAAAQALGLPVWDKPSFACLGSRFPVGTRVTAERVAQVRKVESHLRVLGLRQFRARWHELEGAPMVRLELEPEGMSILLQPGIRESVIEVCKAEGFRWVTIDLAGYRTGNLARPVSATARSTSRPGPAPGSSAS